MPKMESKANKVKQKICTLLKNSKSIDEYRSIFHIIITSVEKITTDCDSRWEEFYNLYRHKVNIDTNGQKEEHIILWDALDVYTPVISNMNKKDELIKSYKCC